MFRVETLAETPQFLMIYKYLLVYLSFERLKFLFSTSNFPGLFYPRGEHIFLKFITVLILFYFGGKYSIGNFRQIFRKDYLGTSFSSWLLSIEIYSILKNNVASIGTKMKAMFPFAAFLGWKKLVGL